LKAKIIITSTLIVFAYFMAGAGAQTRPTLKKQAPASGLQASLAAGKLVYNQYCITCHQADGSGVPSLNPPLSKTSWVLGPKAKLIGVVLKGLNTHEEIDGETYHNVMPPMNFLSDKQVADVLTYVRNSFGNKASAVTVGEVKTERVKK
jgi:mono/diheme cytochrome c family protein